MTIELDAYNIDEALEIILTSPSTFEANVL